MLYLRRYVLGDGICASTHITSFRVDQCILEAMIDCATMNNVTLGTVCAACYAAFLFELTDDWDVAFETTVTNRLQEPETSAIVGNYVYVPLMRVYMENTPETTFVTLLQNVQLLTNSSLIHARAQWDPIRNNTLEQSEDGTSVNYPITGFQFEEYQKNFVLDTSVENGPVLEYVHSERDGLLAGLWAHAGSWSSFLTEAFYMLPDRTLTFGMIFSTVSYNRSTAVSIEYVFLQEEKILILNVYFYRNVYAINFKT